MEKRKFMVVVREVVVDGFGGNFDIVLKKFDDKSDSYKIVERSEVFDNIGDCLSELYEVEYGWYEKYGIRNNGGDEFRIKMDVKVCRM